VASAPAETFLLVDGENIDATLGGSLLGRRPAPEERPRWDRVRDYGRAVWDQQLRGLHDGDFAPQIAELLRDEGRRVGIIGFRELISSSLQELTDDGLELFDLEDDVGAFTVALPRMRVIPIERFDPWALLV
jgi:hypothetical protein